MKIGSYGILAGDGDFKYRMPGGSLISCNCLPGGYDESIPVRTKGKDGNDQWLIGIENFPFRVIGGVPHGERPLSLIWGGKCEIPLPTESATK